MNQYLSILVTLGCVAATPLAAADVAAKPAPLEKSASRKVVTRDPSTIVECNGEYWIFYTGKGTPSMRSKDLVTWKPGPPVFKQSPDWVATEVPNNKNGVFWAPDVMKVGNEYRLYYSVSSMGAMDSAIGLATNRTLDPKDPRYEWKDQGVVVRSRAGGNWNAIDPAIFQDDDGRLWMAFGSHWSGLKLLELDPKTGRRLDPDAPLIPIASAEVGLEAAYLCKRDGYYYLFFNRGTCCQGADSTYEIRVGRSRSIEGPYVDKEGKSLMEGGGSIFLENRNDPLVAPGHAGILLKDGTEWLSCHFEGDLQMDGKATLGVMPVRWVDGWPVADLPESKAAR
jgi:Beta-xylosidase